MIGDVRKSAFNKRIIRESFKERGIYPVNGSKVVDNLTNLLDIPDLIMPGLGSCRSTPSPPPTNLASSSVENTPPKSIEALEKNQAKISKYTASLSPKLQRDLKKVFEHHRIAQENLSMANDTIRRIRAAQAPLQRPKSKRQVKPLS
jgi:hypothetical protein